MIYKCTHAHTYARTRTHTYSICVRDPNLDDYVVYLNNAKHVISIVTESSKMSGMLLHYLCVYSSLSWVGVGHLYARDKVRETE